MSELKCEMPQDEKFQDGSTPVRQNWDDAKVASVFGEFGDAQPL